MHGRAFLLTLGCPKNEADSEEFAGVLQSAGWKLVDSADDADLLLLNTCAFLQSAVDESVETLLEAIEWKKADENRTLILAGCLPGRFSYSEGEEGLEQVDCVVGPADSGSLASFLGFASPARLPAVAEPLSCRYLKIAEGCSNNCSYCTIPLIRGPFRATPLDRLLELADSLVDQGAAEIGIVAQDPCRWRDGDRGFLELLDLLSGRHSSVWWRTYYIYPGRFPFELLNLIESRGNIMPYLDLPLQHYDRRVLAGMGRSYGPGDLDALAERIDSTKRQISVRATVMVGYREEGEEEFRRLREFLVRWRSLRHLLCFEYSHEDGTPDHERGDAGFPEQHLVRERMVTLSSVADMAHQGWCDRLMGETIEVLLDGCDHGHSWYDAPVVDGSCRFAGPAGAVGQVIPAVVGSCDGADMSVFASPSDNPG